MAGQQVDIQCRKNSAVVYSALCYIVCYTVHNPPTADWRRWTSPSWRCTAGRRTATPDSAKAAA